MILNREGSKGITEGVIWKQLLIFFFPLLFGTFLQQLYNTVDAIIVGQYVGKEALSAVGGTTGTLINLLIGFFIGISSGATVTISQYYGGKREKEVSKAVHTAVALAITAGAIIMIIGILGAPIALRWMGVPKEVMPYSLTFIRIYFIGTIGNLLYNMGAGILRAVGDSKRPMYFLAGSIALNIGLDFLFVLVFHWGVAGVAIATVISQICSAILVCVVLMRTNECYRLIPLQIRFHSEILRRIIRIGIPTGLQSVMYTSTNIIIQTGINSFGTNTMAAWTAYSKIDALFWMVMNSFGISVTTFVGQNFGAGKYERVRKGIKICLGMAMSAAIVLSVILYYAGPYIFTLFNKDPQMLEHGIEILRFLVPTFCTYVLIEIYAGALRGMGNSLFPMLIIALGVCAFRIVWIITILPIHPVIRTLIASYPLSWSITSVLMVIYYIYYTRKQHFYNAQTE